MKTISLLKAVLTQDIQNNIKEKNTQNTNASIPLPTRSNSNR